MMFQNGIKINSLVKFSIIQMVLMSIRFEQHLYLFLYLFFHGPLLSQGSSYIDYRENSVTAANFLAALSGDKTKTRGKVLESTSNDNIFIFFSDHGSPGLLHFPTVCQHESTLLFTFFFLFFLFLSRVAVSMHWILLTR